MISFLKEDLIKEKLLVTANYANATTTKLKMNGKERKWMDVIRAKELNMK